MQDSLAEPEPNAWRLYEDARALALEGRDEQAAERFAQVAGLADGLHDEQAGLLAVSARAGCARSLQRVGRLGEALAVHREVVERHGRAHTERERTIVARSMGLQIELFARLERYAEARASAERLRAVFGDAPEPAIQEIVRIGRRMRTSPPSPWRWTHWLNPLDLFTRWASREP